MRYLLRSPRLVYSLLALTAIWTLPGVAPAVAQPDAETRSAFKIFIRDTGVYELTFEQLQEALDADALDADVQEDAASPLDLPSARLNLTVDGEAVPIWLEDGGDGRFGPGDRLQWIGQRRHGNATFFHEHSQHNVYRLSLEGTGLRMRTPTSAPSEDTKRQWRVLQVTDHLEEDRLRLRFGKKRQGQGGDTAQRDVWHWAKITHMDRRPFRLPLDLSTFDRQAGEPLRLRLDMAGWSEPWPRLENMADHQVDVLFNDQPIGSGSWAGQDTHQIEIEVPPDLVKKGKNVLQLEVPKRLLPDGETWLIDVVLLNWLQLEYPRSHRLRSEQERFELTGLRPKRSVAIHVPADQQVDFYGARGWKISAEHQQRQDGDEASTVVWQPPMLEDGPTHSTPNAKASASNASANAQSTDDTVYAVQRGALSRPDDITVDRPADLHRPRQADYLMITHRRLQEAIEPLATMHRQRGLSVEVVDVEDIYDSFNHGIVDPAAVRDFIGHAYHQWTAPRPRFVLLVGDASWDIKNETADDANYADWTYRPGEKRRFAKNTSFAYDEQPSDPAHRNLIPAWSYASYQGHAASDNGFVTVDGDDKLPDLAIGRLPVTEPGEVTAIVDKIRRYVMDAPVGPWRRDILWITNEMKSFQLRSNRLAAELVPLGFGAQRVYPSSDEADNQVHQETLRRSFDDGQLMVHFYGHGGRYIWRTGPPDFEKNHDLFTLDDLDELSPSPRLPLVLSMSCYSAPFDHPTADSIGEKFLRLADRGAIAVLAASWRNSPSTRFSRRLTDELTQHQAMGEAIRLAKIDSKSEPMVALYNLLGDPAIPLALPQHAISIEATEDGTLVADLSSTELQGGQALISWLTGNGEFLGSQELPVNDGTLEIPAPQDPASRQVQVYVWNAQHGRDGLGALRLPAMLPSSDSASAPPAAAPEKD